MKIATYTIAAILAGSASFAGGMAQPVIEPTPAPVAASVAVAANGDWAGFYLGAQLGKIDGEFSFEGETISDDVTAFGVHAGYLHDFGQFVLGAEASYDDADGTDLIRIKGRAGYDAGRWLPYASLGWARASDDVQGFSVSETGVTYGVGVDFQANQNFVIGAEFSRSTFSDIEGVSGLDLDADALQVRASYRF